MSIPYRTLGRTGFRISAVGLGAAEIGFLYGLKNKTLPSEAEAVELLTHAAAMGVTFFDTARMYGVSEERIAKSGITKLPGVVVATKCGHAIDKTDDIDVPAFGKEMRTEVEESLRALRLERLPLLQIHGGSAYMIGTGIIQETIGTLKEEGKVQYVGISTRGEEAALAAIASGFFDTLQLAHSILDQRMVQRVFPFAKKENIGIINRSVLLKGVLTGAVSDLPEGLASLRENGAKAARIAEDAGMDLATLATRFALSNAAVDTVLVGSSKLKNIESAMRAAEAGPLSEDMLRALNELAIYEPRIVDPSLWTY